MHEQRPTMHDPIDETYNDSTADQQIPDAEVQAVVNTEIQSESTSELESSGAAETAEQVASVEVVPAQAAEIQPNNEVSDSEVQAEIDRLTQENSEEVLTPESESGSDSESQVETVPVAEEAAEDVNSASQAENEQGETLADQPSKLPENAAHRADIFPEEVYSSAGVKGARNKPRHDPDGLDLRIEGLLFVSDVPLTISEISAVLKVERNRVRDTLRYMIKSFARRRSALEIRERVRRGQPAFVIDLKAQYRPDVKPLATPALPKRFIETLALIALNQPLSQARLVRELGSKVYDHVRELVERGLVAKHKKGLSYQLRTTQRFSSEFGLSNNAKDLKAMLARAMTDEERRNWDEYRRQNAPIKQPEAVIDAENLEDAFDMAANELTSEAVADSLAYADDPTAPQVPMNTNFEEHVSGPAVVSIDPTASVENSEAVQNTGELSPDWAQNASPAPQAQASEEINVGELGRIESNSHNRLEKYQPAADEETVGRPLTRFEKLFMKLRQRP